VTVFYTALEDLLVRRGEPSWPRNEAALERLFGRLVASHAPGAWLAEDDGATVAFGIAVERDPLWFLSFLFVLPGHQAAGLGRRILECTFPQGGPAAWKARGGVMATCVEALQPVATGLYAGHGLLPRVPLHLLAGRPRDGVLAPLPAGVEAIAFDAVEASHGAAALSAALDALDISGLGHRRAVDHRDDRAEGRQGWLYRGAPGGPALGYGYVQPSGRIGPVLAADAALLEPMIGHLMSTLEPAGAWQLVVPGPSAALPALLRAGLRFDDAPILLSADGPYLASERYLLRSFALP
jgi:GNAT superfamily N-acetyltransferase